MFSNASDRTFNKLLEYPGIKLFVRVFNNFFVSNLNQSLIAGNTFRSIYPSSDSRGEWHSLNNLRREVWWVSDGKEFLRLKVNQGKTVRLTGWMGRGDEPDWDESITLYILYLYSLPKYKWNSLNSLIRALQMDI